MNKQTINRAIKHLSLEVQGNRTDGCFYFTDITTGEQIGDSVYICYLKQFSIQQWIDAASSARTND